MGEEEAADFRCVESCRSGQGQPKARRCHAAIHHAKHFLEAHCCRGGPIGLSLHCFGGDGSSKPFLGVAVCLPKLSWRTRRIPPRATTGALVPQSGRAGVSRHRLIRQSQKPAFVTVCMGVFLRGKCWKLFVHTSVSVSRQKKKST